MNKKMTTEKNVNTAWKNHISLNNESMTYTSKCITNVNLNTVRLICDKTISYRNQRRTPNNDQLHQGNNILGVLAKLQTQWQCSTKQTSTLTQAQSSSCIRCRPRLCEFASANTSTVSSMTRPKSRTQPPAARTPGTGSASDPGSLFR